MDNEKWFGKIAFRGEGVIDYIEGSKEVCEAYVKGWDRAVHEIEAGGEENPLEDYVTGVDQLEMKED